MAAAGTYTLHVDTMNMAAGDVLELRIYQMVLTGGTRRVAYLGRWDGVQPTDDLIKVSVPISNELTDSGALRFEINQTKGHGPCLPLESLEVRLMDFPSALFTNEAGGYLTTACGPVAEAEIVNNTAFNAAAAWPVTNKAFYVPVLVDRIVTVKKMAVIDGATLNGNVDVGIYDEAKNRLVSIGSGTAQAGTSAVQTFDITDTTLNPGLYYLAMSTNSNTATYFRANGVIAECCVPAGCRSRRPPSRCPRPPPSPTRSAPSSR